MITCYSKSHCIRQYNKVSWKCKLDLNLNLWKNKANTKGFSEKLKINKTQKLKPLKHGNRFSKQNLN